MQNQEYKKHRLYAEFQQLLNDDPVFAGMYEDTEAEFLAWCLDYETDADWQ